MPCFSALPSTFVSPYRRVSPSRIRRADILPPKKLGAQLRCRHRRAGTAAKCGRLAKLRASHT
eukprot:scaffold2930_cov244-Pinguiococcus_pyrenoidosus.AAC.2